MISWKISLFFLGLIGQAFFAGSETAFIYVHNKDASPLVRKLKKNMHMLLATTLVGVNLSMVMASTVAADFFIKLLGEQTGGIVSIVVVSLMVLAFGEIMPKSLALRNSKAFSSFSAIPLKIFSYGFYPVIYALTKISQPLAKFFGLYIPKKESFTRKDIVNFATAEASDVAKEKRNVLVSIFEFERLKLHDIMTPVSNLPSLSRNDTAAEARKKMDDAHRNIAIITDENSEYIGFILRRGGLSLLREHDSISPIVLKEPVLPITLSAGAAISNLSRSMTESALISDESGHIEGMITLNTLYSLFGKSRESKDEKEIPTMLEINSEMLIRDLEDKINTNIATSRHYQTVGGMLIEEIGHIPYPGESVHLNGWKFIIMTSNRRKIGNILVKKIDMPVEN